MLNTYLSKVKARVYVLIDRIDEFVIKEEYDIQRLTLQGLIGCERSYRPYHHLPVKLFLRHDLFQKAELEEFGADKVIYDTLQLIWTPEDIRDFLSKRILYNYFRIFGFQQLGFTLNEENLYVDRQSNQLIRQPEQRFTRKLVALARRLVKRWRRIIKHKWLSKPLDPWEGRHTNFNDEISTEIIHTFFPDEVWKEDPSGVRKSTPLPIFWRRISTGALARQRPV